MFNIGAIGKLKEYGKQFVNNHSKFCAWGQNILLNHIEEGAQIEITYILADGKQSTAKMKLTAQDVEMFNSIKSMI